MGTIEERIASLERDLVALNQMVYDLHILLSVLMRKTGVENPCAEA